MANGLQWIRRRQRTLTRAVLALFALAWLQVAVVPCAMADVGAVGTMPQAETHHDCGYCPHAPQHAPAGGGQHDACAYPHEPQAASSDAAILQLAIPPATTIVVVGVEVQPPSASAPPDTTAIPRRPIADSYCRRIE